MSTEFALGYLEEGGEGILHAPAIRGNKRERRKLFLSAWLVGRVNGGGGTVAGL